MLFRQAEPSDQFGRGQYADHFSEIALKSYAHLGALWPPMKKVNKQCLFMLLDTPEQ